MMLEQTQLIDMIKQISGREEVKLEDTFEALEMDSTNIVELLIEMEMVLDIDILDANLNLYDMIRVADVEAYIQQITKG
ncbi:phosphopantetheine-binding protein [Marinicrinis sediminis]|uniref:Phosphopantetheine-binding protein n=1 Tax=Marinicrinis sediminis TaxID=1652465 RepID=A0ABW5RE29_9BACL